MEKIGDSAGFPVRNGGNTGFDCPGCQLISKLSSEAAGTIAQEKFPVLESGAQIGMKLKNRPTNWEKSTCLNDMAVERVLLPTMLLLDHWFTAIRTRAPN